MTCFFRISKIALSFMITPKTASTPFFAFRNIVTTFVNFIEQPTSGNRESSFVRKTLGAAQLAAGEPSDGEMLLGGMQPLENAQASHTALHGHRGGGSVLRMDRLDTEETAGRTARAKALATTQEQPLDRAQQTEVQRLGGARTDDRRRT